MKSQLGFLLRTNLRSAVVNTENLVFQGIINLERFRMLKESVHDKIHLSNELTKNIFRHGESVGNAAEFSVQLKMVLNFPCVNLFYRLHLLSHFKCDVCLNIIKAEHSRHLLVQSQRLKYQNNRCFYC